MKRSKLLICDSVLTVFKNVTSFFILVNKFFNTNQLNNFKNMCLYMPVLFCIFCTVIIEIDYFNAVG